MNPKSTPPIPEAIAQLQRQLDQFRSTQPRRTKLPEPLWQAAVELARQHGIYSVAHPLRLDIRTGSRSYTLCELSAANFPTLSLFPPQQRKPFHKAVLDEILVTTPWRCPLVLVHATWVNL